jgi:hypothetical protein
MRTLAALFAVLVCMVWLMPAYASSIPTHSRYIDYKVVEPCGVVVTTGEVHLEWADCKGDYELVTVDVPGYNHPVMLLFFAGSPDWTDMDAHAYEQFFCDGKFSTKVPNVYCADCNPCDWYGYKTDNCWCGETVCARAFMPTCMALEITDVY